MLRVRVCVALTGGLGSKFSNQGSLFPQIFLSPISLGGGGGFHPPRTFSFISFSAFVEFL